MRLVIIIFLMVMIGCEIEKNLKEINKNIETLISLERGVDINEEEK